MRVAHVLRKTVMIFCSTCLSKSCDNKAALKKRQMSIDRLSDHDGSASIPWRSNRSGSRARIDSILDQQGIEIKLTVDGP